MEISLPHLQLGSSDNRNTIANYLDKSRAILEEAFLNRTSGMLLNRFVTEKYDKLIKALFNQFVSGQDGICLVALGGYGRYEMSPYSDVDLLLLHNQRVDVQLKGIVHNIVYPLWDAGVETGGVVRTVDECLKVADEDIKSLTSMVDSRFLTGDRRLYHAFQSGISRYLSKRNRHFIKEKIAEYNVRLKKYGDSVFVSEPHIKEGEGGLRCYHTAIWISAVRYKARSLEDLVGRGLIDHKSFDEWTDAIDFLWRVRHGLHIIAKRKQERLDYDHQEILSRWMGYDKQSKAFGLEDFMHNFYKRAFYIHLAAERFIGTLQKQTVINRIKNRVTLRRLENSISKLAGHIHISLEEDLQINPDVAFRAWLWAHKLKVPLDSESKEAIRVATHQWGDAICQNSRVLDTFREIVLDPVGLDNILMEMHETGALFRLIPEFEKIYHRVQYDAYHLYTVDIHTIFMIRELSSLAAGRYRDELPAYDKAYRSVSRPDILVMSALLHDIGKGYERKERHDHFGARLAKDIMKRLCYSEEDQDTVEFMVKSHLVLPQIAFCRDINDPQMIENLAHSVKTTDNLILLYLLVFADIRATGPELWSNWKSGLLTELCDKTSDLLTGRGYTARHVKDEIERKEKQILGEIGSNDSASVVSWIRGMPIRYIINTVPSDIARCYKSFQAFGRSFLEMMVELSKSDSYHNVTVLTKDSQGLFSKMCAVFSNNHISILEAQLYTGKNGDVVDLFKVVSPGGRKIRRDFDWGKVRAELEDVICTDDEKKSRIIQELYNKFSKLERHSRGIRQRRAIGRTDVLVDNDVSAYHTVIEIHAPDQVGLLFRVAHWLHEHGYSIFTAKATTHVGRAIDIFYVNGIGGKKADSKKALKELKEGLLNCITSLNPH